MTATKKQISRILDIKNSNIGKIIILFVLMFMLLLTPVVVQSYTSYQQARAYSDLIDNIIYANQLNLDVGDRIEPVVWNIVAGKEGFDASGIMHRISNIRSRMIEIRNNTDSIDNRGTMEISLRALSILESYLARLKTQIDERYPVEENEKLLEEIRTCVAGINDLLQEFSSKQVEEAAVLNQAMARQSNLSFIFNISLTLVVIIFGGIAVWFISRSLMEKSIEEQKQLQIMEHKILQAQITPHFLYNTLDAIIWAAEADNMDDVITLVASLSTFFRISLSHGIDFIPIHDEIEHVRNYLVIQQLRYSDVLSYEIIIDKEIENKKILKLLLQPLVENALYHGIKNTRERGKITVSIKKTGEKLRFSVTDNGIGIKPKVLEELKHEINHGTGEKGYGLFNVNRRLKLYYGLEEGIEIKSEYKKGTEVSFSLEPEGDNV